MSLCPGGCGFIARTCCASVLGQPHQSGCPTQWLPVRVDEGRIHRGRVVDGRLECTGGCDLNAATCYEVLDQARLAEVDPEALCPAWSMATQSTTRSDTQEAV